MSGLHGDEVEGVVLTALLLAHLEANQETKTLEAITVLPIANPDGFLLNNRWNARNVDLNRNWPTKNWVPTFTNPRYPPGVSAGSEPETQVLCDFVLKSKFDLVIDFHSFRESVVLPLLARNTESMKSHLTLLGSQLGIPVMYEQEELGYSISGGFHTWCLENGIDNITLEIEKGLGQFAIKERYLEPVVTYLKSIVG